MREPTVAVTGLSPLQPGRAVLRALREAMGPSLRLIGLSYDCLEPTNYEADLIEASYLIPYPHQGSGPLLDRLRQIHSEKPFDVIFPTLDTELPLLSRLEGELGALGVKVAIPDAESLALRSKARLPEAAERAGALVPYSRVAHSWEQMWKVCRDFAFPFFVKGQYFGATLVHNGAAVEAAVGRYVADWGFPVVLQNQVKGPEYDVIALGDGRGELLGAVPMKKLQLDDKAKAWGGITVEDPEMLALARQVVSSLRWRGILELELMRHQESDEIYLIEINPRVPAWGYLAVAAGQNLMHAALRVALGEEVAPLPPYRVGVMHARQCFDVVCDLDDYEALVMHGGVDRRPRGGRS